MPTLQELLEKDFGVESEVKTASAPASEEIDRLAAALGLDFEVKQAEEKEEEEEDKEEDKGEKKASAGLGNLFNQLFPEDEILSKTAEEQEKIAYEQHLGAMAYDAFAERWDRRIEKLAAELTGGATISASTAAEHDGNPHEDVTPPQSQKTNKPANAKEKIDTAPVVTDEVSAKNDARTVGHYEQKHAAVKQAALRKAFLLSMLEN